MSLYTLTSFILNGFKHTTIFAQKQINLLFFVSIFIFNTTNLSFSRKARIVHRPSQPSSPTHCTPTPYYIYAHAIHTEKPPAYARQCPITLSFCQNVK